MASSDIDFLLEPRWVTYGWHVQQALHWLQFGRGRVLDNVLVYASFELRAALERYAFEVFLLLNDQQLDERERKACRSLEGTIRLIKERQPAYEKLRLFNGLVFELNPTWPRVTLLDLRWLDRRWRGLSDLCHKQNEPKVTYTSSGKQFQVRGFQYVEGILRKLVDSNGESNIGFLEPRTMRPELRDLFEAYQNGSLSLEQAETRLKLMAPVLDHNWVRPPY